jgi:hypothetical protein
MVSDESVLNKTNNDKRFGGKMELNFNLKRVKLILHLGILNETVRIDA